MVAFAAAAGKNVLAYGSWLTFIEVSVSRRARVSGATRQLLVVGFAGNALTPGRATASIHAVARSASMKGRANAAGSSRHRCDL